MDVHEPSTRAGEKTTRPLSQTISHTGHRRRPSTASQASLESYDSASGDDTDVDDLNPLNPDMDATEFHRRKKAQLMTNGEAHSKKIHDGNKRVTANGVKGHPSDSSGSPSEDLEMKELHEEDELSDDEETGLTKADKKRRKRRRRRDTGLDARIGGSGMTAKQEQKIADKAVLRTLIVNIILIGSWYFFSLSLSIYNKWMFGEKYLDFHFPLFTTCLHMLVQFCLASLVLYFVPSLRPRSDSITNPHNHARLPRDSSQPKQPLMTRMFYLTRCVPCGAATGLDIGLGNMSMKIISLTFYTMCKSSSLAFVLSFAFIFRLEKPTIKLVLIIATMTVGVIMMVAGETEFNALGFALVMSAAFFSGFRWSLTQILLLRSPATSNPFSSIFYLAPVMFLSLAIIAIPVEGFAELAAGLAKLTQDRGVFMGICILFFPGLLAFSMTASEFALLQRTSVVTLSICGIFKEVVTISAAGIVFHDPLTPINISGLLITIASIAGYNYIKIMKMRQEQRLEAEYRQKAHEEDDITDEEEVEEEEPMLASQKQREERADSLTFDDNHGKPASITSLKTSRAVE